LKSAVVANLGAVLLGTFVGHAIGGPPFWTLFLILLVFGAIVNACLYWFLLLWSSKRLVAVAERGGAESWTVSDDGIAVANAQGNMALKWTALRDYVETTNLILLRVRTSYLALPKRCLTTSEKERLLQLLNAHDVPIAG
jgi:YcxB-like protein